MGAMGAITFYNFYKKKRITVWQGVVRQFTQKKYYLYKTHGTHGTHGTPLWLAKDKRQKGYRLNPKGFPDNPKGLPPEPLGGKDNRHVPLCGKICPLLVLILVPVCLTQSKQHTEFLHALRFKHFSIHQLPVMLDPVPNTPLLIDKLRRIPAFCLNEIHRGLPFG